MDFLRSLFTFGFFDVIIVKNQINAEAEQAVTAGVAVSGEGLWAENGLLQCYAVHDTLSDTGSDQTLFCVKLLT